MRFRLLPILAVILLLAACHSVKLPSLPNILPQSPPPKTLADAKKALDDATPCCTSFADFSYQNQLPWTPQQFVLGNGTPVAAINGVHSYFISFKLPVDAKLPYKIALKSELSGRSAGSGSYLFAPTVALLNDAFQPIDTQDVKLCEYMGWSNSNSGAFGSVTVTDKRASYVVVYSSGKQQSDNTYWEQSASTFSTTSTSTSTTPAAITTGGSYKIKHGPDGTVWVGMMDKSYAEAVDKAVCGKAPPGDGLLHTLRNDVPAHLSWSSL
jgi:maltose operon periplasmic protein